MGEYTGSLSVKGFDISPEHENYQQELLDVAQSFRTFDAALEEFLVQKGYSGDISDTEAKVSFIKEKFDKAGIALEARIPRSWFRKHIQADNRDIAFKFCFAFQLTLEETGDFFKRVYLQRSLDCHTVEEAIYYYCIRHRLTYSDAQELMKKAPVQDGKGSVAFHAEVLYTGTIIKELDRFQTPEELLAFLNENSSQFAYNNATAKRYINELWRRIAGEDGLAYRELCRRHPRKVISSKRSAWEIYLQIFGLLDYDTEDNSRLFPLQGDRTVQSMLKDNSLVHPLVRKSFPDRQYLEEIIKGNWQSDEVVRKTMILLAFYRFWAELFLKDSASEYAAKPHDAQRCIASINRLLLDSSYPDLYEGNPYDWIFLFAAQDDYPLEAIRFFMREVYLNKEEACNKPQ